jgi:F0F1-type ATP synthase assembly protein I
MIKNLLGDDDDGPDVVSAKPPAKPKHDRHFTSLFDSDPDPAERLDKEDFVLSQAEPESFAETTRKSGLAWSAGIAFFASVVFMLILGWGADLLLGSSPWGLVGGIVLGSIIGFVQFFRLTSQIFK